MHGITAAEICFYSTVWAIAFIAAFARTIRDGEYISFANNCSLSCTAGLLSFGSVCVLAGSHPDGDYSSWYWLGFSALIGLFAKEQDRFGKALLAKVFAAGKVFFKDEETKDDDAKD